MKILNEYKYGDGLHWDAKAADDMLLTVLKSIKPGINNPNQLLGYIPKDLKKSIKYLKSI